VVCISFLYYFPCEDKVCTGIGQNGYFIRKKDTTALPLVSFYTVVDEYFISFSKLVLGLSFIKKRRVIEKVGTALARPERRRIRTLSPNSETISDLKRENQFFVKRAMGVAMIDL
jgi:hypothetical protein